MTTYTAHAERSGNWWAISVPKVNGAFSQARTVSQIEPMARSAVALLLDVPEDEVSIDVVLDLAPELDALVVATRKARAAATEAADLATSSAGNFVSAALEAGLSQREIAIALDVTPQRVNQLTAKIKTSSDGRWSLEHVSSTSGHFRAKTFATRSKAVKEVKTIAAADRPSTSERTSKSRHKV